MENAGKEDMPDEAERKGLGTPATRAAIIEKLVSGGFVERKGKKLIPTKAGVNLITVLPELLTSPKLTADWEQRLNEVAKGQTSPEDFMDGIEAMAAELVRKYSHISEDGQKLFQPEKETVGLCPRCGKPAALEAEGYTVPAAGEVDFSLLSGEAEQALIKKIAAYSQVVRLAARDYDPSHINRYLTELAGDFHRFYTACRIKGEERPVLLARLKLADTARSVLKNAMTLIGCTAPEKM